MNEHDFESDAFALICVFYIGAILCFALSANYHTFTNLSDFKRFEFVLTMDFVGICALIYSSFIPGVYFGFACFPRLQVFYCIITTVLIMMCVLCALDSETGLLGKIRVALTAGTVIFGLVPLFHWCAIMPYEEVYKFFPPTISMLAMYAFISLISPRPFFSLTLTDDDTLRYIHILKVRTWIRILHHKISRIKISQSI